MKMEAKIIIDKSEFDRLIEIEKNFDEKIKENKEYFKRGLDKLVRQNLVKILWTKDKRYAEMMGCDLSEDGVDKAIRKEDADSINEHRSDFSYNREDLSLNESPNKHHDKIKNHNDIKDHNADYKLYQETISKQRKTIHNLCLSFVAVAVAWLLTILILAFLILTL